MSSVQGRCWEVRGAGDVMGRVGDASSWSQVCLAEDPVLSAQHTVFGCINDACGILTHITKPN